MKYQFKKWVVLWLGTLLLLAGMASAKVTETPLEQLEPSRQHRQTAVIIAKVMEKYHYRPVQLDKARSSEVLDRYVEALDPNRSFFTAQDIADFNQYRNSLLRDLSNGRVEPAFDIFKRLRLRIDQRIDYAVQLLDKNQFDFTTVEDYQFDREKAPWIATEEEMRDLWRKRVKNDILGLRLAKKEDAKITETLRKRYEGIKTRTRQTEPEDVFQAYMNAFAQTVEPHTAFMSPERSENFDISMRLSLQGIGAVLRTDGEYTEVQSTVPGGPAATSGQIKPGDKVVGVAQGEKGEMEDIIGWRLQDVVEKIRGEKGTIVRLQIIPKAGGDSAPAKELSLVRDEVKLENQAAKKSILQDLPGLEGKKFGVIDVPAFYRDFQGFAAGKDDFRSTTKDVRKLLAELKDEKVDGVIIDLRDNGGGSLTEATELTGLFIAKGPVVQVKDAQGKVEVERDADPDLVYGGPLAVLVDRDSASASEIFAGAIQDYQRGIILGEPTFGKGTVQTLLDLNQFSRSPEDLGRMRLTIAQFFRVQGASTQHKGVVPDVTFPTAVLAGDYGEKSLDNALPFAAIQSVTHDNMGVNHIAQLEAKSAERQLKDPGFNFLVDQEKAFREAQDEKTLSLVESDRRKQWAEREKEALERRNKLRAWRGLEPLTSIDDEAEDEDTALAQNTQDNDPEGINRIMQEEAARVLTDFIHMQQPVTAHNGT